MIYEFSPTQDLHGYDKPWPAGGGKNLSPTETVALTTNTTTFIEVDGDGTESRNLVLSFQLNNASYASGSGAFLGFYNGSTWTYCTPGQAKRVSDNVALNALPLPVSGRFYVVYSGVLPANHLSIYYESDSFGKWTGDDITDIMVEIGTTPTSYAPYSNICPPEGFNIWDPTAEEFVQVYAGYVNTNTRELYLRPVYTEYDGEELVGPWMSSMDEYSEDATPTTGAFVIDFGGELTSFEITPFMLQTLLDSLGIRQHFTDGAGLLNSLMDQAQGRVRSEEELLHLSRPLKVIAIGDQLPAGITIKPISKDVLPGLPGKFIR